MQTGPRELPIYVIAGILAALAAVQPSWLPAWVDDALWIAALLMAAVGVFLHVRRRPTNRRLLDELGAKARAWWDEGGTQHPDQRIVNGQELLEAAETTHPVTLNEPTRLYSLLLAIQWGGDYCKWFEAAADDDGLALALTRPLHLATRIRTAARAAYLLSRLDPQGAVPVLRQEFPSPDIAQQAWLEAIEQDRVLAHVAERAHDPRSPEQFRLVYAELQACGC